VPHRLVFAARGTGPFQLAYGHRAATVGAFAIGTLVPGYESDESLERRAATAGITIGIAGGADAQPLGGDAVSREHIDWKALGAVGKSGARRRGARLDGAPARTTDVASGVAATRVRNASAGVVPSGALRNVRVAHDSRRTR
jgi:hypothetical protein